MPSKPRIPNLALAEHRLLSTKTAIEHLKKARYELRLAGARSAASYVARALKSAEGAVRHAQRLVGEAQRAPRECA